jgi:hypothetical protein
MKSCRKNRNRELDKNQSDLGQTIEVSSQNVAPKAEVREFSPACDMDQSCFFQLLEMVGQGGRADLASGLQVTAWPGTNAAADLLQDLVAPGLCQRASDLFKLPFR